MNFRVVPEAQEEADVAAEFYESREVGLGLAFVLELQQTYRRVQFDPESWPRVVGSFHRASLHRFPYDVIFRVSLDEFLVFVEGTATVKRRWRFHDE